MGKMTLQLGVDQRPARRLRRPNSSLTPAELAPVCPADQVLQVLAHRGRTDWATVTHLTRIPTFDATHTRARREERGTRGEPTRPRWVGSPHNPSPWHLKVPRDQSEERHNRRSSPQGNGASLPQPDATRRVCCANDRWRGPKPSRAEVPGTDRFAQRNPRGVPRKHQREADRWPEPSRAKAICTRSAIPHTHKKVSYAPQGVRDKRGVQYVGSASLGALGGRSARPTRSAPGASALVAPAPGRPLVPPGAAPLSRWPLVARSLRYQRTTKSVTREFPNRVQKSLTRTFTLLR